MSLNRINTYRSDGKTTLLIGHTTDSVDGGVTERLDGELKHLVAIVSSLIFSTAYCTPNIGRCSKVWNKSMVQAVLGRSIS